MFDYVALQAIYEMKLIIIFYLVFAILFLTLFFFIKDEDD